MMYHLFRKKTEWCYTINSWILQLRVK